MLIMSRFLTIMTCIGLMALMQGAMSASAQDLPAVPVHLLAKVTYLTTDNVYLDVGRDHGVHQGDTLEVSVREIPVGRLRVTGTARTRSVSVFAGESFDVAVGDTLLIRVLGVVETVARGAAPADEEERPSILGGRTKTGRVGSRRPVHLSGRIRLSVNARRTATDAGAFDASARSTSSPSASLRFAVVDLPGGWDAVLETRLSRRFSSNSIVGADGQARVYRLSLSRSGYGHPLEVEAGRFPLIHDAAHSYWDGIRAGYRAPRFSAGVAFGTEPDTWNGIVQTDVPKAAAYVDFSLRPGAWRVNTTISAVHVRPSNEWLDHTYMGVRQDFRTGELRVGADLLVDREPEDGGWSASRINLRATIPIVQGVRVTARHYERRPYNYWRSSDVLGTRRRRESLDLSWSARRASVRISWTSNTAEASVSSTSWAGSARVSETSLLRLGFSVSASQWSRIGNTSRFTNLAVTRRFGTGRAEIAWRHYELKYGPDISRSESVRASVNAPLGHRFRLDGSSQYLFGDITSGLALGLGITYTF